MIRSSIVRSFTVLACLVLTAVFIAMPATAAWQVVEEQRIEVDGLPIVLSDDGEWIAGVSGDSRQICVWKVVTLAGTCEGDFNPPISQTSITWSPDGTAVAFSLEAGLMLRDSDIYVFETGSGTVTNLTEDDPDGTGADKLGFGGSSDIIVPVDVFPTWSPDGEEIAFARSEWGGGGPEPTYLMTMPRSGGEPVEIGTLDEGMPLVMISPMHWQDDGSILLGIWHPDAAEDRSGLWRATLDGDMAQIIDGDASSGHRLPFMVDVTPDGERASIFSLASQSQLTDPGQTYFSLDLQDGEVTPWEEILGLTTDAAAAPDADDTGRLSGAPVFSPDGASVAFMTEGLDGVVHVSILDETGLAREIATIVHEESEDGEGPLLGSRIGPSMTWAGNDTLLVTSWSGIVIYTLAP